jgi:ATP-dependent DNA ligase
MRAAPVRALPASDSCRGGCRYEPKFDGWRALAFVERAGVFLQSRSGRPLHPYFPDVAAQLAACLPAGTVVDGELVVWDEAAGRTSFAALQRRVAAGGRLAAEAAGRPAHLVCFDLLQEPVAVLLDQRLDRRRARLAALLSGAPAALALCPQTGDIEVARRWLDELRPTGVEGLVVKGPTTRYRPGRPGWAKYKTRATTEAIVGGVTGTPAEPEALLLGRVDDQGRLRYVGRTHRIPPAARAELAGLLRPAGPDHPWPRPLPAAWSGQFDARPIEYAPVEPALVVEIETDAAFEHGRWRHAVTLLRPRLDLAVPDAPAA